MLTREKGHIPGHTELSTAHVPHEKEARPGALEKPAWIFRHGFLWSLAERGILETGSVVSHSATW